MASSLMVRKERTGFLLNRVWRAIKKECLHLIDDGVASCEDLDRAWMIAFGDPVGPFGLMDMIGLDVVRDIELVCYGESGDAADAPPQLLRGSRSAHPLHYHGWRAPLPGPQHGPTRLDRLAAGVVEEGQKRAF